jgi:hypothetical protein
VWFDRRWQMIGWGDLADADFRRVAQEIPFGELFIVLEETPVNFGVEQCCWMVEHGRVYAVSDHPHAMVLEPIERRVRYYAIDRQTARGIIERIGRLHR